MTAKLTAKLSDGQEVELVPEAYCDKGQMYLLRPLNYKPSPPKEVYLRVYSDNSISASYTSVREAVEYTRGFSGPSNIHRYILAPESGKEPECMTCGKEMERIGGSNRNYFCRYCVAPKPAREWWVVYVNMLGRLVVFDSKEKAYETYPLHKVVHVREVVSNNKENV